MDLLRTVANNDSMEILRRCAPQNDMTRNVNRTYLITR